jgi:hypothetical protein
MPARTTAPTSPISHAHDVIAHSAARRLRIGAAAIAASVAVAIGVGLATDGDSAGSSSEPKPGVASVTERPDIDPRQAAENFHHRR